MTDSNRRHFLAASGAGIASLAGCTDQFGRNSNEGPDEGSPEPTTGNGDERRVAMFVQPDPQALQQAQSEVFAELEDGEIDESEFRQRLGEREQELLEDSIDEVRPRLEEFGLVHHDTAASEGALLVEGEPAALLDTLETEMLISGISPESRFEVAKQREGADPMDPGPTGDELPEDDDGTDSDD